MPYLNLDLDYFTHPKVERLVEELGTEAFYYPIRLWCYAGKHFPQTGILHLCTPKQIEKAIGWSGESGKLVEKLVQFNFIELSGDSYRIHDWKQHAGHLAAFKKRAKSAAKARWKKYATSIPQAHDKQCLSNAKGYAPNLSSPNLSVPLLTVPKEDGVTPAVATNVLPAKKVNRGSVFPEGFDFNARAEEMARGYGLNVHKEFAAFRDHHTAKGTIFKDWDAAFRTWLRNAVKFAAKAAR